MDLSAILSVVSTLATPVTLLVYRAMRLRLIRHVYDQGGTSDAVAVIMAMKFLPPASGKARDRRKIASSHRRRRTPRRSNGH